MHNPNFKRVQFEAVKNEAGLNRFVMIPTKWITQINEIGITSKAGHYGVTFAHSDIAMSLNWNLNREISKLNYWIHTDAIKENLILSELAPAQVAYIYANEADMLNVVLFGKIAKQ